MKTLIKSLPWILVVVLAGSHLFRTSDPLSTDGAQSEIKEIKSDRDSLLRVIAFKTDTLSAIRGRVEHLEFQLGKAKKERKELIDKYESITFKRFDSDSARIRAWAKLYPSLRR